MDEGRAAKAAQAAQADFFSELMGHQINAREFFCADLLEVIARRYGYGNLAIFYFDTEGNFLSWRDREALHLAGPGDPYTAFKPSDIVRHAVHRDAMRDKLTYFNTQPRLYKSTDVCDCCYYGNSAYANFMKENFGGYYSVTMAFGINAYIQLVFFKTSGEGDFTDEEVETLERAYVYIASSYKTFKKYEQARIVSALQGDIIASGARAFLVTDDAMHVMSYNKVAEEYLEDLLGAQVVEQLGRAEQCTWLPFLLGGAGVGAPVADARADGDPDGEAVRQLTIKDYTFQVHPYDRTYSNKIIDRYSWVAIIKAGEACAWDPRARADRPVGEAAEPSLLTRSEQRVAELLARGSTYQQIADELIISFHTVKKHVQNIYAKCGVNDKYQFMRWFEEHR